MKILAIDPGNEDSAWVVLDTDTMQVLDFAKESNAAVLERIYLRPSRGFDEMPDALAVEMIASYGMPVGREVFDTCVWVGRFSEAWNVMREGAGSPDLLYRKDIKRHLCGNLTAKDPHIRQRLIDIFGPGKDVAIGNKKAPGPLYGIANDVWSALAVAVVWADTRCALTGDTRLTNHRTIICPPGWIPPGASSAGAARGPR